MTDSKFFPAIAPMAIALLTWQIAAQAAFHFRGVAFPTLWETSARLADLPGGDALLLKHSPYVHTMASLKRWLAGFSIAASLGIAKYSVVPDGTFGRLAQKPGNELPGYCLSSPTGL